MKKMDVTHIWKHWTCNCNTIILFSLLLNAGSADSSNHRKNDFFFLMQIQDGVYNHYEQKSNFYLKC